MARQKGLDEHYETAVGTPQPKKTIKRVEPVSHTVWVHFLSSLNTLRPCYRHLAPLASRTRPEPNKVTSSSRWKICNKNHPSLLKKIHEWRRNLFRNQSSNGLHKNPTTSTSSNGYLCEAPHLPLPHRLRITFHATRTAKLLPHPLSR